MLFLLSQSVLCREAGEVRKHGRICMFLDLVPRIPGFRKQNRHLRISRIYSSAQYTGYKVGEVFRLTIDGDICTINIPPRATAQQYHRTCQLGWIAHPPYRIPRSPYTPCLLETRPMVQDRVHIPRADAIHSDPISCPLGRERVPELQ